MLCKIPLQIVLCSVLIASINGTSFEPLTPLTNGGRETNAKINSSNRGQNTHPQRAPVGNVNSSGVDKLPSNLDSLKAKTRAKRVILFRPLFVYRQQQARREVLQRKFNLRRSGQRVDPNMIYPDYHHQKSYPNSGRREPFNCYC